MSADDDLRRLAALSMDPARAARFRRTADNLERATARRCLRCGAPVLGVPHREPEVDEDGDERTPFAERYCAACRPRALAIHDECNAELRAELAPVLAQIRRRLG